MEAKIYLKPKKKAKELVNKCAKALFETGFEINKDIVITSALLCVDEFLNYDSLFVSDYWYWESVKKHIKKM